MTHELRKPDIAISRSDHARLLGLAERLSRGNPELADQLFLELERASVRPDEELGDVVRMGTTLEYATDAGEARTVTLVFPGEEDISAGRISVLTPIGVALIGLAAGDSMDWSTRNGQTRKLMVKRIEAQPAPESETSGEVNAAP